MINNIENIVSKYWAGETSLEEEQQLRDYLNSGIVDDSYHELIPLFEFFSKEKEQTYNRELTLETLQANIKAGADNLLEKYFQGESSLADEEALKNYFASGDIKPEHVEYVPMFQFFVEQETVQSEKTIDLSFTKETTPVIEMNSTKQPKVRRLFPRLSAIAASLALLMAVSFAYFSDVKTDNNQMAEVENPEEALEMTMDALAYLGVNYDKGTNPMKHIKQLEKTNIFKFN